MLHVLASEASVTVGSGASRSEPALKKRRGKHGQDARTTPCAPRNIYLDLGVNWCNTLTLYDDCPEAREWKLPGVDWQTWGFEAAPLIMPFAEQCAMALSAGQALPVPPVPPAGSTKELMDMFRDPLNCTRTGSYLWERHCTFTRLRERTSRLHPDRSLMHNRSQVKERLARATNCERTPKVTLIPAAAIDHNGWLSISGGKDTDMAITGGVQPAVPNSTAIEGRQSRHIEVMAVDFVRWFEAAFTDEDFVVLKIDVEGAEVAIVDGLLQAGVAGRVDVMLWECHWYQKLGVPGQTRDERLSWCRRTTAKLRHAGVRQIHQEPFRFETSTYARSIAEQINQNMRDVGKWR